MKLQLLLALLGAVSLGAPTAARADGKCGAHQHQSVEKDTDEDSTVKRCVCDDGWNAAGPVAPCKKVKPGKTKPAKTDE
ncbi:MAG TPA: hypothetical protein VGL86_22910 [Polyangia bacterium]|jgi:hypothetical protein